MDFYLIINLLIIFAAVAISIRNLISIRKSRKQIKESQRHLELMKEIDWCIRLGLYETVDIKAGRDPQLQSFISIAKMVIIL